MLRFTAICVLSGVLGGCGAANPQLHKQLEAAQIDAQNLRQAYQAQNQRIEAMQDRMSLMEDRLETALLQRMATLPVARLAPAPAPAPAPVMAAPAPQPMPVLQGPVTSITQADMEALEGPSRATRRRRQPVEPPANAAHAGNIGVQSVRSVPAIPAGGVSLRKNQPAAFAEPAADDAIAAYKRASRLQNSGNLAKAIDAFDAFIKNHPKHGFADNALLKLGEAKYAQVQYGAALKAFRQLVASYPDGNMVPEALLMIGKTQEKLGRLAQGRETLARLMTMFPSTPAARKAAEALESMASM